MLLDCDIIYDANVNSSKDREEIAMFAWDSARNDKNRPTCMPQSVYSNDSELSRPLGTRRHA